MEFINQLKKCSQLNDVEWNVYLYKKRQLSKNNSNPYNIYSCEFSDINLASDLVEDIISAYIYKYEHEEMSTSTYAPNSSKHTIDSIKLDNPIIDTNFNYLINSITNCIAYNPVKTKNPDGYILKGNYCEIENDIEINKAIYFIKTGKPIKTLSTKRKVSFSNSKTLTPLNTEYITLSAWIDSFIIDNTCYITTNHGKSFWLLEKYNQMCRLNFISQI